MQFSLISGWVLYVVICLFAGWLCYTLYPPIILFFRQWYHLNYLVYLQANLIWGHLHVVSYRNVLAVPGLSIPRQYEVYAASNKCSSLSAAYGKHENTDQTSCLITESHVFKASL